MLPLIRTLFDIALLRKGPESVPRSGILLLMSLVLWALAVAAYNAVFESTNQVSFARKHPLWHGLVDGSYFYFMNSYYAAPQDDALVTGRTRYGLDFASALGQDNWFATQFHPEKSAKDGLQLLANFVAWDGKA